MSEIPPTTPTPTVAPQQDAPSAVTLGSAVLPRRHRRGWLLGAIALAVVLAVVAAAALIGRGKADTPKYSLAAAVDQGAPDEGATAYTTTITVPMLGELSISGVQDHDSGRMSLDLDLGDATGTGVIHVILDPASGHVFVGAGVLGGLPFVDAEWLSTDLGTLADDLGVQLESLTRIVGGDSRGPIGWLDPAEATVVGDEELDGAQTRRYTSGVSTEDLLGTDSLAVLPGFDQLAPELSVDVWVDRDNRVRQVVHSLEVAGEAVDLVTTMEPLDDAAEIVLPAGDEVIDLTEVPLIGSLLT